MNEDAALVSVIMPVYDGARFLAGALENLRGQAWPSLEVVIVDDGSRDATPAIAGSLGDPVRYIRQENGGAAAARNTGIRAARGTYIAFLDVDDLWPPGKLAVQIAALRADPALDMCIGRTKWISIGDTEGIGPRTCIDALPGPTAITPCVGAAVVRRAVFDRVGLFNPALRMSEDLDWFIRAKEAGVATRYLPDVTLLYRRHDANMTLEKGVAGCDVLKVLKRSLDRRRGSGPGAAPPLGGAATDRAA